MVTEWAPRTIDIFLERAAKAELRNTLAFLALRPETWSSLLATGMPSSGTGLPLPLPYPEASPYPYPIPRTRPPPTPLPSLPLPLPYP